MVDPKSTSGSSPSSPLLMKYLRAYAENPGSKVFAPLAEAYRKLGMLREAMDVLQKGIPHHPDYPLGYLCLANCYTDQRQWELAYSTLRPIVAKNLENLKMQKLFAEICLKLNRPAEALETFKYLLYVNPRDKEIAEQVVQMEAQAHNQKNEEERPTLSPRGKETSEESSWVELDFSKQAPPLSTPAVKEEKKETKTLSEDHFSIKPLIPAAKSASPPPPAVAAQEVPKTGSLMITFTLAELYQAQGHYKKAIEVLHKYKDLGHNDERVAVKIAEIQKLLLASKPEETVEAEESGEESSSLFQFEDENEDSVSLLVVDDEAPSGATSPAKAAPATKETKDEGHQELMQIYESRVQKATPDFDTVKNLFDNFLAKVKKRAKGKDFHP